jgi:protein-tyrosine phosphatase
MKDVDKNLSDAEKIGYSTHGQEHYIDIHCHCLPGVDDGPATMSESLSLCRALVDEGVTTVIATPHQLGRFNNRNEAKRIRERVADLNSQLENNGIGLNVFPGGDVRIDERICQLIKADRILTLADGGKYILLELPHEVFIDIEPLLAELATLGIKAIISHPERHPVIAGQPSVLLKWLARSAYIQITCASLIGDFGVTAQKTAWHFLSLGWVCFVATDAHDLDGRRPRMKISYHQIRTKFGKDTADRVCIENPLRVVEGREVLLTNNTNTRKWIDERIPTTF